MKTYTVIAYKDESTDYCRGCVMNRYGPDLKIFISNNIEEIVEKVADYTAKELGINEDDYYYTILINGKLYGWTDNEIENYVNIDDAETKIYEELENESARILSQIITERQNIRDKRKELKIEEEKKRILQIAHQKEIEEKKEFERLKKKFEP